MPATTRRTRKSTTSKAKVQSKVISAKTVTKYTEPSQNETMTESPERPNRPTPTQEETDYDSYAAVEKKKVTEEEVLKKLETSYQESKAVNETAAEDDDPLSYFAKLAEG